MIVFGPVPSRRLGRSLGINNIPPKTCTYACTYCQVGTTNRLRITREHFYGPDRILAETEAALTNAQAVHERVDVLTFVPDGEPTLDIELGRSIDRLRPLGVPVAVITNGSLMTDPAVRDELMRADIVSVKVDAVVEGTWRKVNRPERRLRLEEILDSICSFAGESKGRLLTETMLVRGLNDDDDDVDAVGGYLSRIHPAVAYLSVPIRPPAEGWVKAPPSQRVGRVVARWKRLRLRPGSLTDYEGSDLGTSHEIAENILSIAAVHPIREDALRRLLTAAGSDWTLVADMLRTHQLMVRQFGGQRFYVRGDRTGV